MSKLSNGSGAKQLGKLFVISAPSGAGKTSLVTALIDREPSVTVSRSCTTRPKRPHEINGVDYDFVDQAAFQQMIKEHKFLEHAEVFGNFYGTPSKNIDDCLERGHHVLLEIDWQGAEQVRQARADCASIFILPPSKGELARRLRGRGTDADEVIERRLSEAQLDISKCQQFDFCVVNDVFNQALDDIQAIILEEPERLSSQREAVTDLLNELLS